jgi:hypothetical protein
MWSGFIYPTEDDWGISKLQDTIQHKQVYWKISYCYWMERENMELEKRGKLQQTKIKVTKILNFNFNRILFFKSEIKMLLYEILNTFKST